MVKKYTILFVIIIILLLSVITTPYYLVIPGQGLMLDKYINTENGEKDARGFFMLTSTSLTKASCLLYLYSFFDRHIELKEIDRNLPESISQEQYLALMENMMNESQTIAKIVALRKAGYFPEIKEEGIIVNGVLEISPAKGEIFPGDIILKLNNNRVKSINDFSACINKYEIGEIVKIYFQRNGSFFSTEVPIIDLSPKNTQGIQSGIGLFLKEKSIQCQFPLEVSINLEGIKGSSAGLMMALEILNQLTENDLTSGLIIAGTGTLDINGNIGPVDGIRQKIISAKKNKANVFLIPKQNYHEAISNNIDIKIIPVAHFDEAIMQLVRL